MERANPNTAPRFPNSDVTTYSSMHLMSQSVLLITQLLLGNLLQINELDPLRRYTPSYERNRKMGRYSVFQVLVISFLLFFLANLTVLSCHGLLCVFSGFNLLFCVNCSFLSMFFNMTGKSLCE